MTRKEAAKILNDMLFTLQAKEVPPGQTPGDVVLNIVENVIGMVPPLKKGTLYIYIPAWEEEK